MDHSAVSADRNEIAGILSRYAHQNTNLAYAAAAGSKTFQEWVHYPANDAYDRRHNTMFYYHAHSRAEREPDEHGHFHVFATSQKGLAFHHLLAISLNPQGVATRLFLTNRWVTDETWLPYQEVIPLIAGFRCSISGRLGPVAQFITQIMSLYRSEIDELHQKRDAWFKKHSKPSRKSAMFLEDKTHNVIAQRRIDLLKALSETEQPRK